MTVREPGSRSPFLVRIADTTFRVHSGEVDIPSPDARYRPFVLDDDGGRGEDAGSILEVNLTTAIPPSWLQMPTLFDPGEGWEMKGEGRVRVAVSAPPAFSEPVWCARFEATAVRDVCVACGPALRTEGGAGRALLRNPMTYPLDLVLMMYALIPAGGLVLHAAGIEARGTGLVFPGRSGAGKSTLAGMLEAEAGFSCVSDDRVVITRRAGRAVLHGTPWHGDSRAGSPTSVPLAAMVFPKPGIGNALRPLDRAEVLERLLPAVSIPWYERELVPSWLDACGWLVDGVPAWEFSYRPGEEAVDLLRAQFACPR